MTKYEERAADLLREMFAEHRHAITREAADCARIVLAAALRETRMEAIEEAAKVCMERAAAWDRQQTAAQAARTLASSIRALATEPR